MTDNSTSDGAVPSNKKPRFASKTGGRSGDVLFVVGTPSSLDAWHEYASGYGRAARMLAERVLEERTSDTSIGSNYSINPILFLYRHYLEIQLKSLIILSRPLIHNSKLSDKIERTTRGSHNITYLWKLFLEVLKETEPEYQSASEDALADLETARQVITWFSKVDSTSTAFRYPESKDGKASILGAQAMDPELARSAKEVLDRMQVLESGILVMDVRQLLETMTTVTDFLEGVDTGFSEALRHKYEAESYSE